MYFYVMHLNQIRIKDLNSKSKNPVLWVGDAFPPKFCFSYHYVSIKWHGSTTTIYHNIFDNVVLNER